MLARGVGEGFRHFGLVCRQTGPTDLIRLGRRKPRGREVRLIWIKSADREWRGDLFAPFPPPPVNQRPREPIPRLLSAGLPPRPLALATALLRVYLLLFTP